MANGSLLRFSLVDTEHEIFVDQVEFIIAPACEGEIGIYAHHVPLISKLNPGVVRVKLPQQHELVFAISGGFIEISNNHATILADIVERSDALDRERLLVQKEQAMARIKKLSSSSLTSDVAKAQAALDIAIAGLKTLEYLRKRTNKV